MPIDLAPTHFFVVNPEGSTADGNVAAPASERQETPWRRPLPQRLRVALNLGVLCCFLVAGLLIAYIRANQVATQAQDQLRAEARAVAAGMALALAQQDRVDVRGLLEGMVHRRDFAGVALYDTAAKRIAAYAKSRALLAHLPPVMAAPDHEPGFFEQRFPATLQLREPVRDRSTPLGTLVFQADLGSRWHAFYGEMAWICAALLLSLLACAALVNLVQQNIVEPVYRLERTCRVIAEDRDYTLRAWKAARDEVGAVVDCVNHLLDEIHRRGTALVEARAQIAQALAASAQTSASVHPAADDRHSRAQFLANMCHELRTPLNRAGALCRDLLGGPLTPTQRESISAVQGTSDLLIALLDDMLDYVRLESGRLEMQSSEFDPREVVDTVLRMHGERARGKHLTLTSQHSAAVPARVLGDRARLRQVISTLVGNAIKYTHTGEISVNLGVQRATPTGIALNVEVLDQGFGIAEEARLRIFEALTTNLQGQSLPTGSAGLGITIANHLIQRMGGTLGLHAATDGRAGFNFCVRVEAVATEPLPAPASAHAVASETANPSPRATRSRRGTASQARRRSEPDRPVTIGEEMQPEWTEVYLDSSPELFESLRQAVAGDSPEAVREAAHLLGTCSARVGANQVADYCRSLENLASQGDFVAMRELIEELTSAFDRARGSLARENAARHEATQLPPHSLSTTLQ